MALELKTIQPIKIDDVDCKPYLTAELRLRLGEIKQMVSEEDRAKAIATLGSCFPENSEYVREKLEQMTVMDLQLLQAYLLAGQNGVDTVLDGIKEAMSK